MFIGPAGAGPGLLLSGFDFTEINKCRVELHVGCYNGESSATLLGEIERLRMRRRTLEWDGERGGALENELENGSARRRAGE